jgi:predicted RNase H-like HicB family nuclease
LRIEGYSLLRLFYGDEMRRYLVVVEGGQNGENYSAYSPDVDGCVATGDTLEEVIENMYGALQFHLEGMALDGEELPDGSVTAVYLAIPEPAQAAVP